ncbi:MAG: hypothetical protein IPK83_02895 [Planctomycetes bacterium]|nr:hypothetical protein [Planctomycetota bacterium]
MESDNASDAVSSTQLKRMELWKPLGAETELDTGRWRRLPELVNRAAAA